MDLGIYILVIIMKVEIKERAAQRLNELNVKVHEDKALRIRLLNYSWRGAVYGVTLDKLNDNDIVIEVDGFRVCVNKNMDYIEKFTIDYSVNPLAKGFQVYVD